MCRLFGFRSVIQSQVHQSLVDADNALGVQSERHPHGWGVAYYAAGAPHIVKSVQTALSDNLFQKVSGVVSSETVLAHVRLATHGEKTILNTHPFQFGNWVFAHNGNIKDFEKHRDELKSHILPKFKRYILGETDSEILFYVLMSHISSRIDITRPACEIGLLKAAVSEALDKVMEITGPYSKVEAGNTETYYTFIITNGTTMLAHQGGQKLYYSTYKNRCVERDTCPSFAPECEAPTKTGYINHLIFSSEPLSGENVWLEMQPGEMIGVDWQMKL
ncbi:MAG: class II glutamine amidotransferase [Bdellovibrionaceae bacterium]|nr:class II glutamine amidotransferase [Pseudobdellovibrionaceae bacterium]